MMKCCALLWLALASAGIGQTATTEPADPFDAPTRKVIDRMHRIHQNEFGRISIKGHVVDDEGQPVKDVTVKVVGVKYIYHRDDPNYYEQRVPLGSQAVTRDLDIAADDVSELHLEFMSDGYYHRTVSFIAMDTITDRKKWAEAIDAGKEIRPKLEKSDLKVVLDKHGPFQKLWRPHAPSNDPCELAFRVGGSSVVANVAGKSDQVETEVAKLADEALPPEAIYITCDLNAEGMIPSQRVKIISWEYDLPQNVKLVMKGGEGFAAVPPMRETATQQRQWMREAPEKGYTREIALDAGAIKAMTTPQEHLASREVYFYFKTSKYYGKGSFRPYAVEKDGTQLRGCIVLDFQLDGSRNVTTSR